MQQDSLGGYHEVEVLTHVLLPEMLVFFEREEGQTKSHPFQKWVGFFDCCCPNNFCA